MFKFKSWEEEQKLADYDRLNKDYQDLYEEMKIMKQSLINCENSRQEWVEFANKLQEENRELYAEVVTRRKNDEVRQKMAVLK